jgi:hypothetical protein
LREYRHRKPFVFLTLIDPSFSSDPSWPPKKGCLKMGIPFVLWRFKNSRDLEVLKTGFSTTKSQGFGTGSRDGVCIVRAARGCPGFWGFGDGISLIIGVSTQAVRLQRVTSRAPDGDQDRLSLALKIG